MTRVYINEINPYKAQWLRNLVAAGLLPEGTVIDTRSIEDVRPDDVRGFDRCHFFGGIGGWALALQWADWPAEAGVVWTCGCPCQPFSAAGKRNGLADERHLWPAQHWLVDQCRPDVLLGEQVASSDALTWLDLVSTDMEGAGYTGGATDLCVAGFGGPQIRQRLWLTFERLADANGQGLEGRELSGERADQRLAGARGVAGGLADADSQDQGRGRVRGPSEGAGARAGAALQRPAGLRQADGAAALPVNGYWGDVDWLYCTDGRWRPVEPGTFPLAHGIPGRVGRLRAYGETISPVVASAVAKAYLEVKGFTGRGL